MSLCTSHQKSQFLFIIIFIIQRVIKISRLTVPSSQDIPTHIIILPVVGAVLLLGILAVILYCVSVSACSACASVLFDKLSIV